MPHKIQESQNAKQVRTRFNNTLKYMLGFYQFNLLPKHIDLQSL